MALLKNFLHLISKTSIEKTMLVLIYSVIFNPHGLKFI